MMNVLRAPWLKFPRTGGSWWWEATRPGFTVAMAERSASSWISTNEEWNALRSALTELPDDHRVVLEMFYWDELATSEIAQVLAISPVTVRTRLHRARTLLETRLRREQSARSGY